MTKITAWPVQFLCFRTKVYYEDKTVQGRKIKGAAILVSNHTSVFDYAALLFVFLFRTLRYHIAEMQFDKKVLGPFLRALGGIKVERYSGNMNHMLESEDVLKKGGVIGIFPEGRLPLKNEEVPLPFLPGAAYLSMATGVKVIPVYTNGSYFSKKRCKVMIGAPMSPDQFMDPALSDKENLARYADAMRQKVVDLEMMLNGKEKRN